MFLEGDYMKIYTVNELINHDFDLKFLNALKQLWHSTKSFQCINFPKKQDLFLYINGFTVTYTDKKKNVYIANMVKCRPPQNRDQKPDEQELCLDWLRQQFKIIRPKIIICVGRIAAQKLISPDFKVTRQHGQFIKKGNILFMGTFHPAALLRNEAQKADALSDFQKLREKIKELEIEL